MTIPTASEFTANALRAEIDRLLAMCTEKEEAFFYKIHASAPWKTFENCPDDKLSGYYDLVRRTLNK